LNLGIWVRVFAAVWVVFLVLTQVGTLSRSPVWQTILFSIVVLTLMFLLPWWLYFISFVQRKVLLVALRALEGKETLRFIVFTLGTLSFLLARTIAWFCIRS
jgi:hypothetical protein